MWKITELQAFEPSAPIMSAMINLYWFDLWRGIETTSSTSTELWASAHIQSSEMLISSNTWTHEHHILRARVSQCCWHVPLVTYGIQWVWLKQNVRPKPDKKLGLVHMRNQSLANLDAGAFFLYNRETSTWTSVNWTVHGHSSNNIFYSRFCRLSVRSMGLKIRALRETNAATNRKY